jgi:hypothetical protein
VPPETGFFIKGDGCGIRVDHLQPEYLLPQLVGYPEGPIHQEPTDTGSFARGQNIQVFQPDPFFGVSIGQV